jgi:hypothetical protein
MALLLKPLEKEEKSLKKLPPSLNRYLTFLERKEIGK